MLATLLQFLRKWQFSRQRPVFTINISPFIYFVCSVMLCISVWRCTQTSDNAAVVQAGTNLCLPATAFSALQDTMRQRWYVEHYNLDTAVHFFSKMVLPSENERDTIYISIINRLPRAEVVQLLQQKHEQVYESAKGQTADFNYEAYFLRQSGRLVVRYLITDGQRSVHTLFDCIGQDSAALQRSFRNQTLLKQLKKCI